MRQAWNFIQLCLYAVIGILVKIMCIIGPWLLRERPNLFIKSKLEPKNESSIIVIFKGTYNFLSSLKYAKCDHTELSLSRFVSNVLHYIP